VGCGSKSIDVVQINSGSNSIEGGCVSLAEPFLHHGEILEDHGWDVAGILLDLRHASLG